MVNSEQSKRNALDSSVFEAAAGAMKGTVYGKWHLASNAVPPAIAVKLQYL